MPTQLLPTRILNAHFSAPVDRLLGALHIPVAHPNTPITNAFSMELLVFGTLMLYFLAVRLSLSVEKPKPVQHVAEAINEFVSEQGESIIGHGYERFVSYITTLFLGPVWWLYPLMLPIEIISHFARVLSLTVRLYANMFAGDMVTLAFFSLIPVGIPLAFLALHFGVAIIQAYVFMILATVYLSLAVAHEH